MTVARFVVLEQAEPAAVRAAVDELAADGASIVHGWRVPRGAPAVCVDRVASADDAARAVLAALAGARLVIEASAARDVVDRLCDDLRRIGELEHRIGSSGGGSLTAEQRSLLALLLAGATLGEAARSLHISRRTADRRLAAARAALGARTTAETLRIAARSGVTPVRK